MYLIVNHANWYIKEKNGNKYLTFDDTANKNKGLLKKYANVWSLLKKYADVWDGIKSEIKTINGGKENNYEKD